MPLIDFVGRRSLPVDSRIGGWWDHARSASHVDPQTRIVLKLVSQGSVLPTGVTRFTVSPRALHLNYPLHELSSGKPLEYKEAYLQHWIQERVKKKGVRHYAEATFLFDE